MRPERWVGPIVAKAGGLGCGSAPSAPCGQPEVYLGGASSLDLPTSWTMPTGKVDDFTARMFEAINGVLLDMLAAVARKDYEDRRRRQMQGQEKAKAAGKYVGRPENTKRNAKIAAMLRTGASYSAVQGATGCGRATVAKIAKRL